MPLARESRRGFALNCRLGGKGSQKASMSERLSGVVAFMVAGSGSQWWGGGMINKVDKSGHRSDISAFCVYYIKRHEYRRGCKTAQRAHYLRAFAARTRAARGAHERPYLPD